MESRSGIKARIAQARINARGDPWGVAASFPEQVRHNPGYVCAYLHIEHPDEEAPSVGDIADYVADHYSLREIGAGDYAVAFDLPRNQVLKITTDPSEARVHARLLRLGIESPSLPPTTVTALTGSLDGTFALVMTKYERLAPDFAYWLGMGGMGWIAIVEAARKGCVGLSLSGEERKFRRPAGALSAAVLALFQNGIELHDFKAANIMQDAHGIPVLVDMGRATLTAPFEHIQTRNSLKRLLEQL